MNKLRLTLLTFLNEGRPRARRRSWLMLRPGALVLIGMVCWTALAAEPPTDGAQPGTNATPDTPHQSLMMKAPKGAITGGIDPHGDSLLSIQNSLEQFANPAFVLRLFLSLTLAVGCAWLIASHPRNSRRAQSFSDLEERKALIILGVAGAIVAELGGIAPTLAFVIFGIGALLRFRTVLDNPKATGKAILVVVVGMASGMGSWMMAVFVTAFSWVLLYWLDSHHACQMTIRLNGNGGDPKLLQAQVQRMLATQRCRVQGCTVTKGGKRMEFLFQLPAGLDQEALETTFRDELSKSGEARVKLELL
jgi:hypothetical protein